MPRFSRPVRVDAAHRWPRRPVLAALVRAGVFVIPVGSAVAAGTVTSRLVPRPYAALDVLVWLIVIFSVATVVLLLVDRLARRFLPLASLLNLSLLFPARAPRRLAVARKVGTVHQLEQRLAEARAHGVHDDASVAAERILTLVAALQLHDRRTRGHAERVRMYTDMLVTELGLPEEDGDRLRWAALLHDIGKLAVSADLLNKPEALDADEWHAIRHHPDAGAQYCGPLLDWLGPWGATIAQHHERWDGDGYPRRLAGQDICYGARIVAVPDAYEVMTAARPYKPAMSAQAARDELARCAGAQFDPAVVRAFLNLSIRRMWWVMGPATWIFQLPFVQHRPRLAATSTAVTIVALGVASVSGGSAIPPAEAELSPGGRAATPALATTLSHAGGSGPTSQQRPSDAHVEAPKSDVGADEAAADVLSRSGLVRSSIQRSTPSSGSDVTPPENLVVVADPWAVPRTSGKTPTIEEGDAGGGAADPENRPPVLAPDAITIDEGGSASVNVLANDRDPDGTLQPSTLTISRKVPRPLGSVSTVGAQITFVDGFARKRVHRLTYRVCDDDGACASAPLTVTVQRPVVPTRDRDQADGAAAPAPKPVKRPGAVVEEKTQRVGETAKRARSQQPDRPVVAPDRPDERLDRATKRTTEPVKKRGPTRPPQRRRGEGGKVSSLLEQTPGTGDATLLSLLTQALQRLGIVV